MKDPGRTEDERLVTALRQMDAGEDWAKIAEGLGLPIWHAKTVLFEIEAEADLMEEGA